MKVLSLTFFCSCCISLAAQSTGSPESRNGWGPGEIGECFEEGNLPVRFRSGSFLIAGNSLYQKGRKSTCFAKILDFDFDVRGLSLSTLSDRRYISIWTGDQLLLCDSWTKAITYSSVTGSLNHFLAYPIEHVSGRQSSVGCIGELRREVDHEIVVGRASLPSLRDECPLPADQNPIRSGREVSGIDIGELTWALRSVNLDPDGAPSISDFLIDGADLWDYVAQVHADVESVDSVEKVKWNWFHYRRPKATLESRDFFLDLPHSLDTISPEVIRAALLFDQHGWNFTGFEETGVTLVNEADDTVFCHYRIGDVLGLPCRVRYHGVEFETFNINLARLVFQLLPEQAREGRDRQNVKFLFVLAHYLYEIRKQGMALTDSGDDVVTMPAGPNERLVE